MPRRIRTLLFSTLFPSVARPVHGIFVETRLRELLKSGEIETKVVAPVPWFPFNHKIFGEYGQFAATPRFEHRNGIDVYHPRYFLPPKIGMNIAPHALAHAALPVIRKIIEDGFDFDLIDAHYYYPDGIAANFIAQRLGKPFVITARGTDLNLIPRYSYPRKLILQTTKAANASIGVCRALIDTLEDLGAEPNKLKVFRNGVDLVKFQPDDRDQARSKLQLTAPTILLSVGHLIERKGHHIAIQAMPMLPADVQLVIAGAGPERLALETLSKQLNLQDRVFFTGQLPNAELKGWYSAADALVLCSDREGWANVLLESMACGTPVIATNIWGTPEVVSSPDAGVLMRERSAEALAEGFAELFRNYPSRSAVRAHAERFSWQETTEAQLELFRSICSNHQRVSCAT
ncbi:MAG: glycosyltransferase family 4 protein [Azonexus sp.]|jgi:glycosyltransferase involved in cell wall biosynthesis|uniref:glycosyltransferase family 4 protein n=1 Tax=Azonexus sp. TaxID=1872668 RepID=UPI0028173AF4|nr:glycosyltransferase family 4 protein [Azonexus sp.]MDR0775284.1 glycosyltransferase family 4 protein [Azonexus sp.]